MDKAPDFGSGDCRFKSCHPRNEIFGVINMLNKEAIKFASQKVYKKCKRQTTNTLKIHLVVLFECDSIPTTCSVRQSLMEVSQRL